MKILQAKQGKVSTLDIFIPTNISSMKALMKL